MSVNVLRARSSTTSTGVDAGASIAVSRPVM